jgi:hypothetical protein
MPALSGGAFLIEVETAPNVWTEAADLTRVQRANNVAISRTRTFRKTYRRATATDLVLTLNGLLNYLDAAQYALLVAERTNTSIRIRWSEQGDPSAMQTAIVRVSTITHEATPAPGELQTVTFELRTTDVSVSVPPPPPPPPTSLGVLKTQYNALGALGTGAVMRHVYQRGINQVIADGHCTEWRDAVTNGIGAANGALVPSPETPAGALVGGDGDTSIVDVGLEMPASYLDTIMVDVEADLSSYLTNPTPGAPAGVNAPQTIFDQFKDHTKGLTIGLCVKPVANTHILHLTDGSTDSFDFQSDAFAQWVTLADPQALVDGVLTGINVPRMRAKWFLVDTPGDPGRALSYNFEQYGRDLLRRHKNLQAGHPLLGNPTTTGRRLRIFENGGGTITAGGGELNFLYIAIGRENKAQNKLINDYLATTFPDLWADPRQRLGILFGDSWQEGIDAPLPGGFAPDDIGFAHDVLLGQSQRGLARLPNAAFYAMAYSGDTIARAQYPLAQLVADMDFSARTRVGVISNELFNGGNPPQNYYLDDFLRSMDEKVHVLQYDLVYAEAVGLAGVYPAYRNDYIAHAAEHSDGLAYVQEGPTSGLTVQWRARNFNNGTADPYPTGQNPHFWFGLHPGPLFNQTLTPKYQAALLRAFGDNVSSKVVQIIPTNIGLDLVAGGATGSGGAYAMYNALDTSPGVHTLTFDVIKADGTVNKGWSDASDIASVDAAGTVTPHAPGHVVLRATSDDGAVTFVDIVVT